jgi:hypothetical protein
MTSVNRNKLGQVLSSYSALNEALPRLTEPEVLAALDLEAASQRRRSVLDRLISRAVRLNELEYQRQLKEKYHGTSQDQPDPGRTQTGAG